MPTLFHPAPGSALSVAVDASESHVGAVLQQQMRGSWFPLSFYSRKLNDAERKYSPFDRELLAVYSAIHHFRLMLEGRSFTLYTDYKPLTFAISRTSRPGPPVNSVISLTSPSSTPAQFTYLEQKTESMMFCPDLLFHKFTPSEQDSLDSNPDMFPWLRPVCFSESRFNNRTRFQF